MPDSPAPALEIHSSLTLKGQLSMVNDVVLTGKFEGDLQTHGSLTVAEGGVLRGTIDVGGLILKPGNLVEARVRVGAQAPVVEKTPAETSKPKFSGWKRGFQKLKELAMGKA
jgi:cytoskeletal protein CcmA (bactofilin family)